MVITTMSAEFSDPIAIPLEERRVVRVVNPHATINGNAHAYLNDIQEHTALKIEKAPVVFTHKNPAETWGELSETARSGDLLHAECGDGTVRQVVEFMASRASPDNLVMLTTPTGNAKNDHRAVVAKELWLRPSQIIKLGHIATLYPLRSEVSQPEDEEKELPALHKTELAVAIASIGGIATGAVYLEGERQRMRRTAIKRRVHDRLGNLAAELATLGYDASISVFRALPHIGNIRYAEHPNGLQSSVAEAFANARDVAKVAHFSKANLLEPRFEYGTIDSGKLSQLIAIFRLVRGTLPTETVSPTSGRRLHFRLAPDQAANMEHDGDPQRLRAGSSIDVDQVSWGDTRHRPIAIVTATRTP